MLDHKQNRSIHHTLRKKMKYEHNLTEEQNIAIDKIFPCWTMERDENGFIVIYPNIQDEERFSSIETWTMVKDSD